MRPGYLTSGRLVTVLAVLVIVLAIACGVSLAFGSERVPVGDILAAMWARASGGTSPLSPEHSAIVFDVRLPRLALALVVGASLSVAGSAFQALLRNPLAEPYILGVSSGAALGAVLSAVVFAAAATGRTMSAFAGALVTIVVVYAIGEGREGAPTERLILAGVIVNAFLSSAIIFLMTLTSEAGLRGIYSWLIGDLSGSSDALWPIALVTLAGGTAIALCARSMNLLMLGERDARALGVATRRVKVVVYCAASMITAASVAVSGMIGFVGLVIPHAVRLVVGSDNRLVVPASALVGAAFLALGDTLSRTLFAPREIHIGVVTALIGAPVFVYLLRRSW
ncbi:MAG: iron ABC transporter permease [Acidobacteria bacterium]|nr:iron ABC transporter permease [Acidobacteriota bacterium]